MTDITPNRLSLVVGMALVFAGCARFSHQTSTSEPHAILRFASVSDAWAEQAIVKTLDGLPVSTGREYRVRPGQHELVCRLVQVSVETREAKFIGKRTTTEKPSSSGSGKTTVTTSAGITIPGERVVTRQPKYLTNLFSVEAGWVYDVEGDNVSKTIYQEK